MSHSLTQKERAHHTAKNRDARDQYRTGDTVEVVLEKTPHSNNGREGGARINGLVVFVHPGELTVDIGAHLEARLSYVDADYLRAVAAERLDM